MFGTSHIGLFVFNMGLFVVICTPYVLFLCFSVAGIYIGLSIPPVNFTLLALTLKNILHLASQCEVPTAQSAFLPNVTSQNLRLADVIYNVAPTRRLMPILTLNI